MIKKSSKEYKEIIRSLISGIFYHQKIPNDWKLANVYPIPKPKPWGCQLVNTRPITLLETSRKLMVSILNSRLSHILKTNNVLKGYQFAGLPLNSTFEPIRILNEVIQDSNENNKDMWMLSLDMSKAYDRVNIFMLEKALQRIKLPHSFINLIKELFLERKNQIFTPGGLTAPYDVKVGIDQGEIISPLLWCIYYDPLLCEIQNKELGYKLSTKKILNLYENIEQEYKILFPCMAYMDDTNLFSNNQQELEEILQIADDFYNLNDIQINKDKSELLLRKSNHSFNYSEKIKIKFGHQFVNITPTPKNSSIRVLGVWFNAFNKRDFIIKQAQDEIRNLSNNILKTKVITDKQSSYIFNTLILPKIEYRTQTVIFSENECNQMMVPYRKRFKNKLKFASSAPNAILDNNLIYNIRSLWKNQIQAKITNFLIQINDYGILGHITQLRLIDIQKKLWLPESPLINFPFTSKTEFKKIHKKLDNNFILNNILLMKQEEITFFQNTNMNIIKNGKVIGGNISILEIIGIKNYIANIKDLRNNKLLYLEQLTNLSRTHLLTWWQCNQRKYILKKSNGTSKRQPLVYDIIKEITTTSMSLKLKPQFYKPAPITNL
jgi:hypothetical protein